MSFALLKEEIQRGQRGDNIGLSMGFNRLEKYISIRRKIMTLLIGSPGSGKSSYLHSAYILNPFDDYISGGRKNKFKVILFSMERSKIYILAKWMSRKIFLEQGILIHIGRMLGWKGFTPLTLDELNLIDMYEDYFNELFSVVDIIEGAQNPTGIYKYVKDYAEQNGTFEKTDEYHSVYIPNDPKEIVIVAEDHLGITTLEKGQSTKKEAIDKLSSYNQYFRDKLGYCPVAVSQFNRNLSNPIFKKLDSFEPTADDAKESGRPGEDSDIILSLFDPVKYHTNDLSYGDVTKFIDSSTGAKYFRSIKLLKSNYSEDDIRIGCAFHGALGIYAELPRANDMEGFDFTALFNGTYFLK